MKVYPYFSGPHRIRRRLLAGRTCANGKSCMSLVSRPSATNFLSSFSDITKMAYSHPQSLRGSTRQHLGFASVGRIMSTPSIGISVEHVPLLIDLTDPL